MSPVFDLAGHYTDESIIWAKRGQKTPFFRDTIDYSMPVPCGGSCKMNSSSYKQPLADKAHLLSFVGGLEEPVRMAAKALLNNPPRVLITDSEKVSVKKALQSSAFNLILPGDGMLERFNQAVCSGGIPVYVRGEVVPPLEPYVPFTSYGVQVLETELNANFAQQLEDMSASDKAKLRRAAKDTCRKHLQGTALHATSLAKFLTMDLDEY